MNEQKQLSLLVVASVIFGVAVATVFTISSPKYRPGQTSTDFLPAVLTGSWGNSWKQAAEKVKEDRGEPAGKQAKVEIPAELRHYRDTRRFLATQVAEVREQTLKTPRDLVDLANMVDQGEMVALQTVTEDYILFGVGGHTDKDSFTRYEGNESISIYDEAGLQQAYERTAASQAAGHEEIAGLRKQLNSVTKREGSKRASLQAQIANTQKALKAEEKNKQLLDKLYGNANRRARLFDDYATLQRLAKNFRGRSYDLSNPSDRQAMKVALLSSLRPEALEVLEGIASAYRERFERPLPITSLVRPDEYQHKLSKVNPNATRIETPPHSTGLAFDIMYRYMTAEEQSFLMAELARLEDEGRIEVLRENRDHYHVFAFIDGARPDEGLIAAAMGVGRPTKARAATASHHAKKSSTNGKAKFTVQRAKRPAAKTTRKRRP